MSDSVVLKDAVVINSWNIAGLQPARVYDANKPVALPRALLLQAAGLLESSRFDEWYCKYSPARG